MGAQNMPAAEVDITEPLVRSLLAAQHPDLADLTLAPLANGWDNAIYRLGDDHTVRLPRRRMAARLVEYEQRWLPALADRLPIPVPAPVRFGRPSDDYPWSWSVNPWLPGEVAAESSLADPATEAARFGRFMAALHVAAPDDAPENPYRGHFIGRNTPIVVERVLAIEPDLGALVDGGADWVRDRWSELTAVEPHRGPPTWIHGDMHTANVLVDDGELSAVIDFGDICGGDPATDLAVAWMLFGRADRDTFRSAAGGAERVDEATWTRAEAWALHFAVTYLKDSADNPRMRTIGERLLVALAAS